MNNSAAFSTFMVSLSPSLSSSKTFSSLQNQNLYPLSSCSWFPFSPAIGQYQSAFCGSAYSGYFIWIGSYSLWLFVPAPFTWHKVFEVYSLCSIYQSFIPLYGWKIFHFTTICLAIHVLMDIWVVSNLLTTVVHAALNICVQGCVRVPVFSSFGHISKSGIANSMVSFLRNRGTGFYSDFSQWLHHFTFPPTNVWGFQCLYILVLFSLKKIIDILVGMKWYFVCFVIL